MICAGIDHRVQNRIRKGEVLWEGKATAEPFPYPASVLATARRERRPPGLKDDESTGADALPEPEEIASQIRERLSTALGG